MLNPLRATHLAVRATNETPPLFRPDSGGVFSCTATLRVEENEDSAGSDAHAEEKPHDLAPMHPAFGKNGQIFEESAQCMRDDGRARWVREPNQSGSTAVVISVVPHVLR